MSMYKLTIAVLVAIGVLFSACKKDAGQGGLATIKGKVFGYDINQNGIVKDSAYVGGARVYISYGDNTTVDDNVRTSFTGDYEFSGLQKGDYTVFLYSQCDSCPFNQNYVSQSVTITERKQTITLPDFKIFD